MSIQIIPQKCIAADGVVITYGILIDGKPWKVLSQQQFERYRKQVFKKTEELKSK